MSDFNKLSDLLLDERNDSTVTDQEVADYVASVRMGTAAVSSQPVPQLNRPQPINNQPTPKPTPPTQATHAQQEQLRLLMYFIKNIQKSYSAEDQEKLNRIHEAVRVGSINSNEYVKQLYTFYGAQWQTIMTAFKAEVQKLQLRAVQNNRAAALTEQQRQRLAQINQYRQGQQIATPPQMYNNPSATAVKTETPRTFQSPTSESLLGKRPTIASPAPIPPAKRVSTGVGVNIASPTLPLEIPSSRQNTSVSVRDTSGLVNSAMMRKRMQEIAGKLPLVIDDEVFDFMKLALQERLRTVTEQLVEISHKRMEITSNVFDCIATHDPKQSLRDIAQEEKEHAKLREEIERKRLEASNKKDKVVKEKLSRADQKKEDESTNITALNAIGNTKGKRGRRRTTFNKGKKESVAQVVSEIASPNYSPASTGVQEVKRITYKDALVFLERDECQSDPVFIYKAMLGCGTTAN